MVEKMYNWVLLKDKKTKMPFKVRRSLNDNWKKLDFFYR